MTNDDKALLWRLLSGVLAALAAAFAVAAMLLAIGCAGPVPVKLYDERAYASQEGAARKLPAEVVEGCAIWGLDCYAHRGGNQRGDLVIMVTDVLASGHDGRELAGGWCVKAVWVELDATKVAHELGHVFGDLPDLVGDEHEGRLMFHATPGRGLEYTDDELDDVEAAAGRFVGGC